MKILEDSRAGQDGDEKERRAICWAFNSMLIDFFAVAVNLA